MPPPHLPAARRLAALALLFFLSLGSGCGGGGKTYPVSGKVTVNGQPLVAKSAIVVFKPDASKGNTTPHEPTAQVDSSGNYSLSTKNQRGAPPGWYKVLVTAVDTGAPPATKKLTRRPVPKSLVAPKYGQEKSTPLHVEVVASPDEGAYDLKLTD